MASACYISTGQKAVMYTLWEESYMDDVYIKNLPMDKEKAIAEVKKYAKEQEIEYLGVYSSPLHKRAEHIDFHGINFKHKRKGKKSFYYGVVTQEFWTAWRENKEQMKKDGFSVSKHEYRDRFGNHDLKTVWYVFFKPKEDK